MSQVQSPSKVPPGACFRCNKQGHWANTCPERSPTFTRPPPTTSDPVFPSIHCRCGAGLCEIKISGSERNPNRKYYTCPGKYDKSCGYFRWCNELRADEMRKMQPERSYPVCGCGAGVCSVKEEENGVNAGRSYFACPIKKGDGACNFRQWLDNPESASDVSSHTISEQTSIIDEFESSREAEMQIDAQEKGAHDIPSVEVRVHHESQETPEETSMAPVQSSDTYPHPVKCKVSENLEPKQTIQSFNELDNTKCDTRVDHMQASVKKVVATFSNSELQGTDLVKDCVGKYPTSSLPEDVSWPGQMACLYPQDITTSEMTSFLSPPVLPEKSSPLDSQPWSGLPLNPPRLLKDSFIEGTIMAGTILQAFENLAQRLQSDLITLIESMGPQNHKSMRKEADCTFAALDRLQVNYGLLHLRVNEYIKHAASLANVQQIICDNSSSTELLNRYKNEQSCYNEIAHAYCEARNAFMASYKQLNILREKASAFSSADIEKEVSCCEAKNAALRDNLLQITKTMEERKESLQVAAREATEAVKNSERKEIELSAAKAAFQIARAQLRI